MEFIKNYKYALMSPTSMGVRITPLYRQMVSQSYEYRMQATSAESNVLSISSALKLPVKVLTTFVKDSQIAAFIKTDLRKRGIDFEGKDVDKGGPWGYRHQFNIADSGYGLRAPMVENDRAGEVGRTLNIKDFDVNRIFKKEKVALLHVSGLIAALSKETSKFCLGLVRKAKENGTKISFDLNYRKSFWINREEELSSAFKEIAQNADILIGNEEDFQLALGIKGPKAGGNKIADNIDSFKEMIEEARKEYPNVKVFATTLREVENANSHLWGALTYSDNNWVVVKPRPIQVLDRIGGGDAFVGGLLYGLFQGWDLEKATHFGWATGALVVTLFDDFGTPLNEEQIWSIWEGNARVKR